MEQQQERRFDQNSRERIAVLETQMSSLSRQMDGAIASLSKIERALSEAKGGWRILMLLGGGAGAMGAVIAEWWHSAPK